MAYHGSGKKTSIPGFFVALYFLICMVLLYIEKHASKNIIERKFKLYTVGIALTVLEAPLIWLFIWKYLIKPYAQSIIYTSSEMETFQFISLVALPIIFIIFNVVLIEIINIFFDKEKPVKRYLKILNKHSFTYHKKHNRTKTSYYLDITSWISDEPFTREVSAKEYGIYNKNQIILVKTYSGLLGLRHYDFDSIVKIPNKKYPSNIKFPITEDELNRIMSEDKTMQ